MKEIISVYLMRGRNAEQFLFHHNVLAVFTREKAAELKIEELHATYAALFEKEDLAFKQNTAFEQTPEIVAQDRARDDLFMYVRNLIDANLTCPVADKKEAAEKLAFVMRPYRNAPYKSYLENTTLVINMVADLQQEANKTYLTTLGLTEAVAQLKTANDTFNRTFTLRSDERLNRDTADKMVEIRPLVDEAYRAAAKVINALSCVNTLVTHDTAQEALLSQLIDDINAQVVEFQHTLVRRNGGKEPDLPSDGDGTGTDKPGSGSGSGSDTDKPGSGSGSGSGGGTDKPGSGDGDGGTSFE